MSEFSKSNLMPISLRGFHVPKLGYRSMKLNSYMIFSEAVLFYTIFEVYMVGTFAVHRSVGLSDLNVKYVENRKYHMRLCRTY